MSAEWYYRLGGDEFGPVGEDELRELLQRGEIGPKTPVRSEVLDDWTPIGSLDQFIDTALEVEEDLLKIPIVDGGYAGISRRIVAFAADYILLRVTGALVGVVFVVLYPDTVASQSESEDDSLGAVVWVVGTYMLLYFAAFESSRLQSTPGKLWMKIIVTDMDGRRIPFWRAVVRAFGKYVTWLTYFVGFFILLLNKRKQALHDLIARTVVLDA